MLFRTRESVKIMFSLSYGFFRGRPRALANILDLEWNEVWRVRNGEHDVRT